MTRIFLAGIFHETHSFTDDRTGIGRFTIHRGQALLDRISDGSQVDGFLTTARREGWEVVPGATYLCGASGMVDHAVFEDFWDEIHPILGAAIADGLESGEIVVTAGAQTLHPGQKVRLLESRQ